MLRLELKPLLKSIARRGVVRDKFLQVYVSLGIYKQFNYIKASFEIVLMSIIFEQCARD